MIHDKGILTLTHDTDEQTGEPIIKGKPHPVLSDWRNDEKTSDTEKLNTRLIIASSVQVIEQCIEDAESVDALATIDQAIANLKARLDERIEAARAIECDVNPDLED